MCCCLICLSRLGTEQRFGIASLLRNAQLVEKLFHAFLDGFGGALPAQSGDKAKECCAVLYDAFFLLFGVTPENKAMEMLSITRNFKQQNLSGSAQLGMKSNGYLTTTTRLGRILVRRRVILKISSSYSLRRMRFAASSRKPNPSQSAWTSFWVEVETRDRLRLIFKQMGLSDFCSMSKAQRLVKHRRSPCRGWVLTKLFSLRLGFRDFLYPRDCRDEPHGSQKKSFVFSHASFTRLETSLGHGPAVSHVRSARRTSYDAGNATEAVQESSRKAEECFFFQAPEVSKETCLKWTQWTLVHTRTMQ